MSIDSKIFSLISGLEGTTAYLVISSVLLLCGFGLPIPEDITLISAGILAGLGQISLRGAYIVGFLGVLAGDTILFSLGHHYGRRLFEKRIFKKIFTPSRIAKAEQKIHNNARMICFVARFLPGLRAPIYLCAGILRVKPSIFLLQDGLAALLSVPIWIHLGFTAGRNFGWAVEKAKELQYVLLGALLVGGVIYWILKKRKDRKAMASIESLKPPLEAHLQQSKTVNDGKS